MVVTQGRKPDVCINICPAATAKRTGRTIPGSLVQLIDDERGAEQQPRQ